MEFHKDNKDQEYYIFYEFMHSWAKDMHLLSQLNAQDDEFSLIETYDNVDEAINAMTEYPMAVDMLSSVGIKT